MKSISNVFAILVAVSALVDLRWFVETGRQMRSLVALPYEERRGRVFGDFYRSLADVRRGLGATEPVGIVMRQYRDVDRGVFVNYYLYPRRTKFYFGADQFHFDCAAGKPAALLLIDLQRDEKVRRMSEEQILLDSYRYTDFGSLNTTTGRRKRFFVPLVAAIRGEWPAAYITRMTLLSDHGAQAALTFEPSGRTVTLPLSAGKPQAISNLIYETFGATGIGWLRVEATEPIQAAFALTNAAHHTATPLPLLENPPASPQKVHVGEKLWLLNTGGSAALVTVNGTSIVIAPRSLQVVRACATEANVSGPPGIFAFGSMKLRDGSTSFFWPAGQ